MLRAWLGAFVLTQVVEVPLYRGLGKVPITLAFALSAITHPVVWLVFFSPRFVAPYEARLLCAELFAVLVEAALLARRIGCRRALRLALLANAASVLVGAMTRARWGVP
jgi:hypothetical protein